MISLSLLAAALLPQAAEAGSSRMPSDEALAREGVTAEYFSGAADADADELAREFLSASGVVGRNGAAPYAARTAAGYNILAIAGGDGRYALAMYRPETHGGDICLIRGLDFGPAGYRARRWCAARFGIDLPETPTPPVRIASPD